jgi:hypothetical protein
MSETSIIAIILSLIAVGDTLGGTWLGRMLERSNETRKWRRERCLEAYTEVLSSCDMVVFEANKAYGIECGSLEHNNQHDVVLEKVSEMYRTVDKAILLGAQEVNKQLGDLTVYCGTEIGAKSVMCPKLSKDDWHKISVIDLAPIFSDCRNAARNDLEIFPKRYSIARWKELEAGVKELKEKLSKATISPEKAKLRLQELEMNSQELKKEWKGIKK